MPKGQKRSLLEKEGDAWLERNRERVRAVEGNPLSDPILLALNRARIRPGAALEVGASNGWRLNLILTSYGARVAGVEPGERAVAEGRDRYPSVELFRGTADELAFENGEFDLVILGFCLYLCEPEEYFQVAAEADRVLKDRGWIAIQDFIGRQPYRNPYGHRDGLFSHKMDFSRMFTWHPSYTELYRDVRRLHGQPLAGEDGEVDPDDMVATSLIQKDLCHAFPDNPYHAAALE